MLKPTGLTMTFSNFSALVAMSLIASRHCGASLAISLLLAIPATPFPCLQISITSFSLPTSLKGRGREWEGVGGRGSH